MENGLEGVFLRLVYVLRETKELKNSTIILGAGCSLNSTDRDISTWGIMKQCLLEHGVNNLDDIGWEELYRKFTNIVWNGKATEERRQLLKKKLSGLTPTEGHMCLRSLIEHGYIHNVITTNFDMLLEQTFKGLSYRKRVGSNPYYTIGDNPKFNLIKVHGDLEKGNFRFSPDELTQLPKTLQKDIFQKTGGPLIFIGYRGQDIGLMNSLNTKNEYAAYWIDISQFDNIDVYTTKCIFNFMEHRASSGNFLYGKEFGDFNGIITKLSKALINPSYSTVLKSKEFHLSNIWKTTSIVEMLRIYTRVYEIFLDILEISADTQKQLVWDVNNSFYAKNYNECLDSYLYFFNTKHMPSNLLHIPNNELDALILGVSIEVLVRTTGNNIPPTKYISTIKEKFNSKYTSNILNDTFWQAVEKIICSESSIENAVDLNIPDKLVLKTYDIPFNELNKLLRVISFLALLLPKTKSDEQSNDSRYKARQILNGRYEYTNFSKNIINVDLGAVKTEDFEALYDFYIKLLPDIHVLNDTNQADGKKYMVFISKWLRINLEIQEEKENGQNNVSNFYKMIEDQSELSKRKFLSPDVLNNKNINNYVALPIDTDLLDFLNSEKIGMFIVGPSGSGKTSALRNLIINNNENTIPIIISPKSSSINRQGLSLFINIDMNYDDEELILKYINSAMEMHKKICLLIFDGLNEISDTDEYHNQQIHYRALLQLAYKIYHTRCTSIKLIITCREQAYYEYKSATRLSLNPLFFYTNDRIITKNDACYKIQELSDDDKIRLLDNYMPDKAQKQIYIEYKSNFLNTYNIINEYVTPFFIAVAAESMKTANGIEIFKNSGTIYDLFTNAMLQRLEQVDAFLAKKIIYTYFDLVIEYRNSNIQITKFKLLDMLDIRYHNSFDKIMNRLIDVNILIKDNSNLDRIKFQHDKIEEFFFKQYIQEYEHNGLDFFNAIFELSNTNIIYQSGIVQYLLDLENRGRETNLKYLLNNLSLQLIDEISKVLIEVLLRSKNLANCLKYLIGTKDKSSDKKIVSIIIWGIDQSLQDYSTLTFDINRIIDELQKISDNTLMTKEMHAYLYFFKAKLAYYTNNYTHALSFVKEAQKLLDSNNCALLVKLDIHHAVIRMEQGYSRQCIGYLEKDFQSYLNTNDLKTLLEIGIELGRALNHSGQTSRTLKLYDILLVHEDEICDSFILARIYEQKANVLNKLMYHKLQYGFVKKDLLTDEIVNEVKDLFEEALFLYDKSVDLLLKTNAIFTYSGVLPEKINTFISYSFSIEPSGIEECAQMINELDNTFTYISTPFETDFNLAKAYFYEYKNQIDEAQKYLENALALSVKLKIKNKEAKCRCFYSQFAYRQIINHKGDSKKWKQIGIAQLEQAINYYEKHTLSENNIFLEDCYLLMERFLNS